MSREIKFRVRDKDTKTLIGYESFNTALNDGYYYVLEAEKDKDQICYTNYSENPMPKPAHPLSQLLREQFTGLKDKNGAEIYEGDIVYIGGYGLYECEFPFLELYDAVMENDIGEIKGNIYHNPELVED